MATQPTNNAVPSESPRDLKFNAGKIDEFVTSLARQYRDRFGNEHYTIEGLRWFAQQAISQFGYITLDSFQAGASITLPNQILRDTSTGEYYRWDGNFPKTVPSNSTPQSAGGIGLGAWLSVGDGALRNELRKSTGAQLIGVSPSGTLNDALTYVTPEMFGAKGDGTSDDTASVRLAISTGKCILSKTYRTTSEILVPSKAHIAGHGTIIFTSAGNALKSIDTDDILLEGFRIVGTGKSGSDQVGILLGGNKGGKLIGVTVDSVNGKGISFDGGRYIDAYGDKFVTNSLSMVNCTTGMYIAPNLTVGTYPNEYCVHVGLQASNCNTGVQMGAGNHSFSGGHITGCIDGMDIITGYNSAHGTMTGMQFNHNSRYNLHAKDASAGLAISGCTFYGDSQTVGTIYFESSRGFVFTGCMLESTIYTDGAFSWNMASDCYNNGNFAILFAGTHGNRFIVNNWIGQNGPSALNREAFDYVAVNRSGAQSITTGSDVQLILNNLYFRNIMQAFNLSTGAYTAPFDGMYRVQLNLLFSGVSSGYVSIKVSGSTIAHFPITAVSGGICSGVKDINMTAGSIMIFTCNVSGSSVSLQGGPVSGLSLMKL